MKRLLSILVLLGAVSGCAKPVVIDNGTQRRVFIPCTNDNLCFKDTYNVAWDNWCPSIYRDYPVSYRTKQSEYESNRVEYLLLPTSVVEREQIGVVR